MIPYRRVALWLAIALLAFTPSLFKSSALRQQPAAKTTFISRLLGPISELAASLQWIRVQKALQAGEDTLALVRAETALALDPETTEGWRFVGAFLALDLASPNREPDAARRRAFLRAGLEVLARGENSARSPHLLASWRGVVLVTHAETDPDLAWPGGNSELWREAARAFERASELGATDASEMARMARLRATAGD